LWEGSIKIKTMNPEIYVDMVCLLLVSAFLIRAIVEEANKEKNRK